jgi:hypothetical protein
MPDRSWQNKMECPETRRRSMNPLDSERTLREGTAQHNNGMHLMSGVVGRGAYMRARPVVINAPLTGDPGVEQTLGAPLFTTEPRGATHYSTRVPLSCGLLSS